jgi:hypothetical protein
MDPVDADRPPSTALSTVQADPPSKDRSARPRRRSEDKDGIVTNGIALAVAVASLIFSFYIWYDGHQPPEVALTLPDRVRVTQGVDLAWLYIQPRFVSTSSNDRVEVIESIEVSVAPVLSNPSTRQAVTFDWGEQGQMTYSESSRTLSWQWVADPGPLVVSPGNPQNPTGLFYAPEGWFWEVGRYQVTIAASTTVSDRVITNSLQFELTQEEIDQLNAQPGDIFLTIPATGGTEID